MFNIDYINYFYKIIILLNSKRFNKLISNYFKREFLFDLNVSLSYFLSYLVVLNIDVFKLNNKLK